MADISAFHSRFFCSTSFYKKELRSSRAADFRRLQKYLLKENKVKYLRILLSKKPLRT